MPPMAEVWVPRGTLQYPLAQSLPCSHRSPMSCLHAAAEKASSNEVASRRGRRRMEGRWVTTRHPFGKEPPGMHELRYFSLMPPNKPFMRALIPISGAAVASLALLLTASGPAASKPAAKKSAVERDAEAFLEAVTSLMMPVSTTTANVDWVAATDVTPEHTGERTGADKAYASLVGSKHIIEKTKAFLAKEKQLDDLTARQLHKLLLAAAESPGTIPAVVAKRVEAESRLAGLL